MKLKETTNKVVTFVQEHENILLITGLAVCSAVIGWNLSDLSRRRRGYVKFNNKITTVVKDAHEEFGNDNVMFTAIRELDESIKAEDLGKLGEAILNLCTDGEKPEFTHFIAIGPNK